MNERIKELAEQATTDVEERPGTGICIMDKYNSRFAELIIKECIDAVKNTDRTHAYTTFDLGLIDGTIEKSVKSIKQHFNL